MNPKHAELLHAAITKYGVLSSKQVFGLFSDQLRVRAVEYCIAKLKKDGFLRRISLSSINKTLYGLKSEIEACTTIDHRTINHRLACNDVYLALGRRLLVTSIISEYEMNLFKMDTSSLGRRPDGFFTVQHPGEAPLRVAIEVETTWRNEDRVNEVVDLYRNAFRQKASEVNGVLLVCSTSRTSRAYHMALAQVDSDTADRFLISNDLCLRDVPDTTLGRTISPISSHPRSPTAKPCGTPQLGAFI